jgi:eukaryotic-like serine/threonine-protein kinase
MKSGEVIQGKYRLDKRLGIGGMGEVWRATHTGTGREFAVKFMHAHVAASAVSRDRFAREARASAQINHPSIIDIFDVGEHDESLYLVMELLSGMLLVDALAGDPRLTVRDFLAVMHDVVEALGAAHAAGIVHRDVKPENVFLHLDRISGISLPKVLDFGIGKFADGGGPSVTDTGAVLGSPRYMSPEQSRSLPDLDGRSDLWSCGVILFEALTGTFPHDGDTFSSLIISICTEPPESIDALAPSLPESVRSIVRGCLQPVDKRIASAAELAARITLALEDPAIAGLLLARQLHGDGPCSNTEGMRFREIAPGPLSMAMPSRAALPGPVSSSRRAAPRPAPVAPVVQAAATPATAPFKAVARTMPITAEDRARLSAYMSSAANAPGAPAAFVPTKHTAKVDPAILAEAARVLEAKRALAAAPSPQSLQQQPSQQQPSQPRSSDPQPRSSQPHPPSSEPRASPADPTTPQPAPVALKAPSIAAQPTLRSQTDAPADPPASPPEPELVLDVPPAAAPVIAVEPEAALAAVAPEQSGRALRIIAGALALALGGVLATLVATMRSPAPTLPPAAPVVPAASASAAPIAAAPPPEPSPSAAPVASASAAPALSASTRPAPWPSSHYRALASGAPAAPPPP